MSTTQPQTIQAPTGFTHNRVEDDQLSGVYYDEFNGPSRGGVRASWTPDQGIALAVDGYPAADGAAGPVGFDLAVADARALHAHLGAVLELLDDASREDVRAVALEIAHNPRAVISDMLSAAERLGVKASTMAYAVELAWARR